MDFDFVKTFTFKLFGCNLEDKLQTKAITEFKFETLGRY